VIFLGFSESCADYGVPTAEFFCGVIFKAMKPHMISVHEESQRHNTFSKRFDGAI
jgi:hypothetical protein